jgi:hypothetical protein
MDLSRGYKMDYTHLSRAKYPTHWFGAACQLELHEGRTHKALEYLRSEIGLPRVLAEDKIAISELVRFAMAAIARGDTWEAIQASDWRDEDLAKIQEAWASPQFIGGLVGGLQGEVVYEISSGELLRQSNEDTARSLFLSMDEIFHGDEAEKPLWERLLSNLPGGDAAADFLKKQVYCRIWRFAWLDQHERHTLEGLEKLLNIARSAAKEKSFAAADSAIVEVLANREDRSIYDKLRYPMSESAVTLSRTVARAMRAETERSLLICAVALERYSLRHGDPPASLDALVPEFLVSLPIDYMDGKPLRYRLNADKTFTLYSVGEDGKDDGGDATLMPGKTSPQNLWNRKDFVWPAPALPEEVEAYRKEATKY